MVSTYSFLFPLYNLCPLVYIGRARWHFSFLPAARTYLWLNHDFRWNNQCGRTLHAIPRLYLLPRQNVQQSSCCQVACVYIAHVSMSADVRLCMCLCMYVFLSVGVGGCRFVCVGLHLCLACCVCVGSKCWVSVCSTCWVCVGSTRDGSTCVGSTRLRACRRLDQQRPSG